MTKISLGVFLGLIVWGIFLCGSDFLWITLSPNWYGKYQNELVSAIYHNTPFTPQTSILLIVVFRSLIFSIISGFITAIVAQENELSTLILGVLLMIFGIVVHSFFWNIVPYWFHLSIFFQFIPFTMFGGKLVTTTPHRPILVN